MIGLVLCLALAATGGDEIVVSHRKVIAADGVALALYRYDPPGKIAGPRPVLLVGDLGLGRALFDFHGEGLARWLALRGRRVYLAELRGQGRAAGGGFGLADLVTKDLPAVAAAIPEMQFDLVAHGWAGTLALAASVKELKGRAARVVSLNTPAEFAVPSKTAEQVLAGGGKIGNLGNDAEGATTFELLFALGARISSAQLSGLRAAAFSDLGARASAELLQWMRSGDLALGEGDTVAGRLRRYDRPTLQFLALADGWANPELCGTLREVSTAKVRVRTFSKFEPVSEDYSHLSLVAGQGAPKDVFTPALAFLNLEPGP